MNKIQKAVEFYAIGERDFRLKLEDGTEIDISEKQLLLVINDVREKTIKLFNRFKTADEMLARFDRENNAMKGES